MRLYQSCKLMVLILCLCAVDLITSRAAQEQKSIQPTQRRLSWSDDPRTTMTVMWQTAAPTQTSAVEFGPTEQLGQRVTAQRVSYPYETGVLHEATLRGLKPGTRYFYRIVTGGQGQTTMTDIASFRTAPDRPE
ncbi:MAG: fibronectin type III domain-containing protein, partial [Abditibacteriales bacterium]|nr:fibronectin type III domain-containing protein [Abditibacteriales bacterium]